MKNGFLDRTLLIAILAALGGLYWQISDVRERLARVEVRLESVETRLEYALPRPADPIPDQSPRDSAE